jgi:hypothetical protein
MANNGKNVYYLAFNGTDGSSNLQLASMALNHQPLISKSGSYELLQQGGGYAFKWAGPAVSFGESIPNEATHLAITHTGTELIFYQDGTELRRQSTSLPFSLSSSNLLIGSDGDRYFNGILDDLKIYQRSLSSHEIQGLYQQGR